tara:strand:- start:387 stop:692 length:306 start_codon:yes stop_codon:yes gene_type:complete
MREEITITVSARSNIKGELVERCFLIDKSMMMEAMQPIRHNTEAIGAYLEGQSFEESRRIYSNRCDIAGYISKCLTNLIVNKVFAVNDTRNGYLINQGDSK